MELLRCYISQRAVVVNVECVREIVSHAVLVKPMFGSPDIVGLTHVHGVVVPVVSLEEERVQFPYLLIVETVDGDPVGIGVDRCGGVVAWDRPLPEPGTVEIDGETIEVLDPSVLVGAGGAS